MSGLSLRRRNGMVGAAVALGAVAMLGAAYAAVPLYRMYCQLTGYGGTTQVAKAAPGVISDRKITITFDANTGKGMPWTFEPAVRHVSVGIGEETLAFYVATNPTDHAVQGSATFNVAPAKAGSYFAKIECFCFTQQVLQPGETESMGVTFFVDPAILKDRDMDDVTEITLSYTFFEVPMQQAAAAATKVSGPAGGGAGAAPVDAVPVR